METSFLSSRPRLLPKPKFPVNSYHSHKGKELNNVKKYVVLANQSEEREGRSIIDDDMIVLRMKIKKMKVLEASTTSKKQQEAGEASDWKDWEKKLFSHYHEDVCEGMELLQSYLMNTRPSVALGILALLAMSVPLSSSVVLANVLKVARELLAGSHLCIDIYF